MYGGLIRIFLYGVLIYLVIRIVGFFTSIGRRSETAPRRETRGNTYGAMVKDEVCNTYLPREEAIRMKYKGKEYFFCSEECRRKFLETH
jgi:YHS domain-containing protein